jgi:hypothetical protein
MEGMKEINSSQSCLLVNQFVGLLRDGSESICSIDLGFKVFTAMAMKNIFFWRSDFI